jgi:hypothetical protein
MHADRPPFFIDPNNPNGCPKRTPARIDHPTDPDGIALHDPHAAPIALDVAHDADGIPLHLPEADPFTIPDNAPPATAADAHAAAVAAAIDFLEAVNPAIARRAERILAEYLDVYGPGAGLETLAGMVEGAATLPQANRFPRLELRARSFIRTAHRMAARR